MVLRTLLAGTAAFLVATADTTRSHAATPKEIERIMPKGDLQDFQARRDIRGLRNYIDQTQRNVTAMENELQEIRNNIELAKKTRSDFEHSLRQALGGKNEDILDEETRKGVKEARENLNTVIEDGEKSFREVQEWVARYKRILDAAREIVRILEEQEQKR